MTQARKTLVDPSHAASFHCVARCVRRAWLCGFDDYLGKSFEHRKAWVERRILEMGEIFACGIYAFAVMSNHYHLVVHMSPATANSWSAEEVARRWVKLYPTGKSDSDLLKIDGISADETLIALYRRRLSDLSWLMKSISEPIARRANAEDKVNGPATADTQPDPGLRPGHPAQTRFRLGKPQTSPSPSCIDAPQICAMTQARKTLVDPGHAASFHCVARCVRRAWLCGFDDYLGKSFEHRKAWVERRILEVGEIFACGIYAFAVMSNHYHLVVHMSPATANSWSAEEVARRWVKLYPTAKSDSDQLKIGGILADETLVALYRRRLSDLSWLMKSISEPIARRANAEDKVNGRFWQGRFKCQLLRDQRALLAAMTYVDLNPVRAKVAPGLNRSKHTSVRARHRAALSNPISTNQPLLAMVGANSFNAPLLTNAEYLELVDFTGRMLHPGKRGVIKETEPKALTKLGLDPRHWSAKVKGIGNGYWRVVAEVEDLIHLAAQLKQRTLFGIGFARKFVGI